MAKIPLLLLLLFISGVQSVILPLTHTHSPNSTIHHLLKSASLRSSLRFHSHRHRHSTHSSHHPRRLSLPLSPGSDYTLSLSLGPHSPPIPLFMDTGSDLVWFPCAPFECILCEPNSDSKSQTHILPPPPNSTLLPCDDPSCSAAHSSLPSSDLCSIAHCPLASLETHSCPSSSLCPPFYYAYGDGSLIGLLRRGPLSLSPSLHLPNFTFACSHSALNEPLGVAGFGPGLLSLPSQLSSSRFSYCLLSHSFLPHRLSLPSPLILGPDLRPSTLYTPILHNPQHPYFYSVALLAVSVAQTRIPTSPNLISVDRNGYGGLVVDSGTTFTMLPSDLYSKLVTEFANRMEKAEFGRRAVAVERETGMGPCYYYEGRNATRRVPALALHFAGNVSVALPRRNYFLGFERGGRRVGCLMVMDGGDDAGEEEGGPAGTLGNFQQQGFEVVYDLEGGRVGFARRRCADLWDSLA